MAFGRRTPGVRGVSSMAVGQVHMVREQSEAIIQAVNRCYPGQSNGSLKCAMELILIDFLEIPVKLSPEDINQLIEITNTNSICEALAVIGEQKIKEAEKK